MKKHFPEKIKVDEAMSLSSYAYIEQKAIRFLKAGYKVYSKGDAFEVPGKKLSPEVILMLISGCQEVLGKKGLSGNNPFEELGIGQFYQLMRMFHFVPLRQEAQIKPGEDFIIYKITFEHRVTGDWLRIELFNKVKRMV